eukprot:scaffold91573_cov18-Tisochrysis_lutea.AAC.1
MPCSAANETCVQQGNFLAAAGIMGAQRGANTQVLGRGLLAFQHLLVLLRQHLRQVSSSSALNTGTHTSISLAELPVLVFR